MEAIEVAIATAATDASAYVTSNLGEALGKLFDTIDANSDGVISRQEFINMPLASWEVFRRLTSCVSCMPNLPSLAKIFESVSMGEGLQLRQKFEEMLEKHTQGEMSILTIIWTVWLYYIGFVFFFQFLLFCIENWRAKIGIRFTWNFKCLTGKPGGGGFVIDPNMIKGISESERKVLIEERNEREAEERARLEEYESGVDVLRTSKLEEAFFYDTPVNTYERFKMFFFTITGVVFIRMICCFSCFALGVGCITISVWREHGSLWFNFWFGLARFFCRLTLIWLNYHRLDWDGEFDRRAKLLVGNHPAIIEVILLFINSRASFVSTVNNLQFPFFPALANAAQAILVDKTSEGRKRTIIEITARVEDPSSNQLMVFPEGTTSNNRCLYVYKKGAFSPGAPVQPVCFRFHYKWYNPAWTGEATGGNNLLTLLFRTFCQFANRVSIKILPVYYPNDLERNNPELFAENVRIKMAKHLELPLSIATSEDYTQMENLYREELLKSRDAGGHGKNSSNYTINNSSGNSISSGSSISSPPNSSEIAMSEPSSSSKDTTFKEDTFDTKYISKDSTTTSLRYGDSNYYTTDTPPKGSPLVPSSIDCQFDISLRDENKTINNDPSILNGNIIDDSVTITSDSNLNTKDSSLNTDENNNVTRIDGGAHENSSSDSGIGKRSSRIARAGFVESPRQKNKKQNKENNKSTRKSATEARISDTTEGRISSTTKTRKLDAKLDSSVVEDRGGQKMMTVEGKETTGDVVLLSGSAASSDDNQSKLILKDGALKDPPTTPSRNSKNNYLTGSKGYFSTVIAAEKRRKKIQAALANLIPHQFVDGCENWSDAEGGYITGEAVKCLAEYKYHAGKYSWLDLKLNPWWLWTAGMIPRSISPNMVTLIGFTIVSFAFLLMILRTYVFYDTWNRLFIAIIGGVCQLLYQQFDAMDGKHARLTQQSTPLGALWDHGCDTLVMIHFTMMVTLAMANDEMAHDPVKLAIDPDLDMKYHETFVSFLNLLIILFSMFCAQWEHYHRGILEAEFVTETQISAAAFTILCSTNYMNQDLLPTELSYQLYSMDIFSGIWPYPTNTEALLHGGFFVRCLIRLLPYIKDIITLYGLGGSSLVACFAIRRVWKQHSEMNAKLSKGIALTPEEEKFSVKKIGSPLFSMFPMSILFSCAVVIFFHPNIYIQGPMVWKLTLGLASSDLTLRMIISGLCSIRYPAVHLSILPLACYGFLVFFDFCFDWDLILGNIFVLRWFLPFSGTGKVLYSSFWMYFLFFFEIAAVIWLGVDTITRICAYLRIPFLAPLSEPFVYDPKRRSSGLHRVSSTNYISRATSPAKVGEMMKKTL